MSAIDVDDCDSLSPHSDDCAEPPRKRGKKLQGLSEEEAERRRLQSNALVSTHHFTVVCRYK